MTALEYMEKQAKKHRMNFERESARGVSEEMIHNIGLKISYYEAAVEALKKVGGGKVFARKDLMGE